MASSVTDIISVDDMKTELRLPLDVKDHDEMIKSQMSAAASFLSRYISVPLIDVTETVHGIPPLDSSKPIAIMAVALKEIESVRYWSPGGALRLEPDQTIAKADLGRTEKRPDGWNMVWPPADGWPERLKNSMYEFRVTRGVDIDDSTKALAQALVILVRQYYDGYHEFSPTNTVMALIAPWRRYN